MLLQGAAPEPAPSRPVVRTGEDPQLRPLVQRLQKHRRDGRGVDGLPRRLQRRKGVSVAEERPPVGETCDRSPNPALHLPAPVPFDSSWQAKLEPKDSFPGGWAALHLTWFITSDNPQLNAGSAAVHGPSGVHDTQSIDEKGKLGWATP